MTATLTRPAWTTGRWACHAEEQRKRAEAAKAQSAINQSQNQRLSCREI